MNFVFLMDPLETVLMEKDTSFAFMLGAQERGHSVFFATDGDFSFLNGSVYCQAQSIIAQRVLGSPFIRKKTVELSAQEIDAVFVRSDPPFDANYLLNTWLLDLLPKSIPVINSPHGLRSVNEKIWLSRFPQVAPRTLISRKRADLINFLFSEQKIVVKPTDGHGGKGVFIIPKADPNTNVILETLTHNFTREIIAQQYLPEAQQGDKRILLLDGEPLGALLRVHSEQDHRNNFFAGGKAQACEITSNDQKIIALLKPFLKELQLYFVGIDIIGKFLTEVNVTSPTCLQEMNYLYGQRLELNVIEFVEKLVARQKAM